MFTETELRDALQHAADRADVAGPVDTSSATEPKRPWLLPLVAAVSVAALAAGVIAFVGTAGNDSGPTTRDDRAATSIASPTSSPTQAFAAPLAAIDLVDEVVVGVDAQYQFGEAGDRQAGAQTIRHSLGTGRHDGTMTVDIVPTASIDPARVQQGKRVEIAGTTGWFSPLKLYPLDGSTGAGSDKWLPHWTIAFRTPSGDWAFAWIELATNGDDSNLTADDVSVPDSAKIVDAYRKLNLRWTDGAARQALRFATLPPGTTLKSASFEQIDGEVASESLTFTNGGKSLDVGLTSQDVPAPPHCAGCPSSTTRDTATGSVTVVGRGYSDSVQRDVLKGIRIIADPSDYIGFEQALTP